MGAKGTDAEQTTARRHIGSAEAQRLSHEELLRRLAERREQRNRTPRREDLPEHLPRGERIFDLTDEEKAGLKYIGDAVTERLCFEKPHVYVARIIRRKYTSSRMTSQVASLPPPRHPPWLKEASTV